MTQPLELRRVEWSRLFAPRRVVVIGASDTEGTQQRAQWTQVRDRLGARGADVVPVHASKPDILGTNAYPSILDVPGDVDVAVVLVRDALPAVEECRKKGVAFTVVFSAGFGEVGTEDGDAAEARLAELARGSMRVLGPNTNLNIFEPWPQGLPGKKLAIVTQSGYQGRPIAQGQVLGIGIECWATIGNEADLEWADFVGYFSGLDEVGAIATYVEGFKSGRTFMLAADLAAQRRVPIVAIKVGRSDEGAKMARAHTGHLTGSDAVHDAIFEQYGIIRVDDLDEVIEISGMFCHTRLVGGNGGVGVYAMSGGTASHVADLCGVHGVPVPRFTQPTIDALAEHVPWYLERGQPARLRWCDHGTAREPQGARADARRPQRRHPVRADHRCLSGHERRARQGSRRLARGRGQAGRRSMALADSRRLAPLAVRCRRPAVPFARRRDPRDQGARGVQRVHSRLHEPVLGDATARRGRGAAATGAARRARPGRRGSGETAARGVRDPDRRGARCDVRGRRGSRRVQPRVAGGDEGAVAATSRTSPTSGWSSSASPRSARSAPRIAAWSDARRSRRRARRSTAWSSRRWSPTRWPR